MNLHEYQAKALLGASAVPIPRGLLVSNAQAVVDATLELGGEKWVIKAQIHAGGRGQAGGVKLVHSITEAHAVATTLLGRRLVTKQNAPEGQPVNQVLVEEVLPIARELYLSLLVDRSLARVIMVASSAGGMAIEELAQRSPQQIYREICDPLQGLMDYQARYLAFALGLEGEAVLAFCKLARTLYKLFMSHDLTLLEINPLVVTQSNTLCALDCKISLDDNALYRHPDLTRMHDWSQQDSKEVSAHHAGIQYIALNGNIGCLVNGAGLAMATMDMIQLYGGRPANFLDVGGGASAETVSRAFHIILADSNVKAILVNIFGGIMRCDIIAEGIIHAVTEIAPKIPIIVRLEGTNLERGRQMLIDSGLNILSVQGLNEAAIQAVKAAQ